MDYTSAITGLIIAVLMGFLLAASKKTPKEDVNGNTIIRLPKFYLFFGALTCIGSICALVIGLIAVPPKDYLTVILMFLIFFCLGTPLFLIGKFFKLIITKKSLVHTNMWNKTKTILWKDITKVSFGKISLELKIKTDRDKIKIHMHSIGFPYLIEQIEEKTKFNKQNIGLLK